MIAYRITIFFCGWKRRREIWTYGGSFVSLKPSLPPSLSSSSSSPPPSPSASNFASSWFLSFWIAESTAFWYESAAIPLGKIFPLQQQLHKTQQSECHEKQSRNETASFTPKRHENRTKRRRRCHTETVTEENWRKWIWIWDLRS